MKIAVASEGKDENAQVSAVSGRAPYYLIFEDGKLVKALPNPFKTGGGGAGLGVAQMLGNEGVNLIISGEFGSNMQAMCDEKNIKVKVVEGKTAREAVDEVKG
jgi:predicted Fe-Mo cluster-binding NifX family protein